MPVQIQHIIQDCQNALRNAITPADYAVIAGLAAIIQRVDPAQPVLTDAKQRCMVESSAIIQHIQSRLLMTFTLVERAKDETNQQMHWYNLYLDFGALYFVDGQATVETKLNQILLGIQDDWSAIIPFATRIQQWYVVPSNDRTADLLRVTLGDYAVLPTNDTPVNILAYQQSQSDDEVDAWLDAWEAGADVLPDKAPLVIDYGLRAASTSGEVTTEEVMVSGPYTWSVTRMGSTPKFLLLHGATTVSATRDGEAVSSQVVGDALRWQYQPGFWAFSIEDLQISIELR